MIKVVDITKKNHSYLKLCEDRSEIKVLELKMREKFSKEAIEWGLYKIVVAAPDIIRRTLIAANSIDEFVLVIPKIRENVFNPVKQKAARNITDSYDDIQGFINKDAKGVAQMIRRKATIPPEQMLEYLECMSIIAADCVEICLKKFRQDIEQYRSEKHVRWADRSEIVKIVESGEGQKVKRKSEELKDNEGSGEDWRARMASKRLRPDKTKQVF